MRRNRLFLGLLGLMVVLVALLGVKSQITTVLVATSIATSDAANALCLGGINALYHSSDEAQLAQAWKTGKKTEAVDQAEKLLMQYLSDNTSSEGGKTIRAMDAAFFMVPDGEGGFLYGGGAWLDEEYAKGYLSPVTGVDPSDAQMLYECTKDESVIVDVASEGQKASGLAVTCRRLPGEDMAGAWLCISPGDGMLALSGTEDSLNAMMQRAAQQDLVLSLLLVAAIGLLLYKMLVSPVRSLESSVNGYVRVTKERDDPDMWVFERPRNMHRDEIGSLADSVEQMTADLQATMARLLAEQEERERKETELALATKIQQDALPAEPPVLKDYPGFKLHASMRPAKEVGGDFYDYYLIDEDHLGIVIADVSDKGMPAALFMMLSMTTLRHFASIGFSPGQVLEKSNDALLNFNKEGMFVTVWIGMLTLSTGRLVSASAGHKKPVILKPDGTADFVADRNGFVLGVRKNRTYVDCEHQLGSGDVLFAYTDGVTEAENAQGELFGPDRLLEAIRCAPGSSPKALLGHVQGRVDAFARDVRQADDITMLAVTVGLHEPPSCG